MKPRLDARLAGVLLAEGPLLWWIGVTWVVPLLIRGAHAGWIPLLGRLLPGRADRPVDGYLEAWEPIARGSVVVVATLALSALASWLLAAHRRRRAGTGWGDPPAVTAAILPALAAWLGILTGFGEAWYYLTRVFYQGLEAANVAGISQHAVWMSPVANGILFLLVGLLLAAGARAAPALIGPARAVTVLVWLAVLALLMVTGRLHLAAAAVLALGLALAIRRALSPGAGELWAWAHRSAPLLAACLLVLGLAVPGVEWWRERRQLALAAAAPGDAPNVLFIVLDTERAASTGLHGASRPNTPFLDALAHQGVWFERAITPHSWTLPSHAAMFTGRHITDLVFDWNTPLDDRHPTLAEAFARRGYATAGFVANFKYLSDLYGLDRGFGVWKDQPILPGTLVVHSWLARSVVEPIRAWLGNHQLLRRKTADAVNAEFLHWLDRRPDRPFFAFLNYFDAHDPYLPPEPWNLRYSDTQPLYWIDQKRRVQDYRPEELTELLTAYEASMAYLDDRLAALHAAIADRDLDRNTLVVITSDHGEAFGENDQLTHGVDMTLPMTHVPLVLSWPGRLPEGVKVDRPVEVRHLAQTLLDLAGIRDTTLEGESLRPYWATDEGPAGGGRTYSTDGWVASLLWDDYQFLLNTNGRERLIHHRSDPLGLVDLAGDSTLAGVRDAMRADLQAWLAARR